MQAHRHIAAAQLASSLHEEARSGVRREHSCLMLHCCALHRNMKVTCMMAWGPGGLPCCSFAVSASRLASQPWQRAEPGVAPLARPHTTSDCRRQGETPPNACWARGSGSARPCARDWLKGPGLPNLICPALSTDSRGKIPGWDFTQCFCRLMPSRCWLSTILSL